MTNAKLKQILRDLLLGLPYEERQRFIGELYREYQPPKKYIIADETTIKLLETIDELRQTMGHTGNG